MTTTTDDTATGLAARTGPDECCTLSAGPVDPVDAERLASALKALSDPTRLRLLSHVAAQGCDSVCACDLTEPLGISQPTVSHHMKKLVDAGLLKIGRASCRERQSTQRGVERVRSAE